MRYIVVAATLLQLLHYYTLYSVSSFSVLKGHYIHEIKCVRSSSECHAAHVYYACILTILLRPVYMLAFLQMDGSLI
jgi:hypothetical protein